jgi:endonuclease/exonuclease/phosphatase family metal-dependent hydrolase
MMPYAWGLRILSYNILDGATAERLDLVVDIIREKAPDLLCLNECNGFEMHGQRRLLDLERRLGMRGFLARARSGYHVALFVRGMDVLEVHELADGLTHAALAVKLQCSDESLWAIAAHLSPFSGLMRAQEAQLLARFGRFERVVIMGDLNALSQHDQGCFDATLLKPHHRARHLLPGSDTADTRAIAVLETAGLVDLWHLAHPGEAGATYPTRLSGNPEAPRLRLDYIFASELLAPLLTSCTLVDDERSRSASDHLPIFTELAWPG